MTKEPLPGIDLMTLELRTNRALEAADALSQVADLVATLLPTSLAAAAATKALLDASLTPADAAAALTVAAEAVLLARAATLDAVLISVCIAEGSKTTLLYPGILSSLFRLGHRLVVSANGEYRVFVFVDQWFKDVIS